MLARPFLLLAAASLGAAKILESVWVPLPWNMTGDVFPKDYRLDLTIVLPLGEAEGFLPTMFENPRLTREEANAYRQPSNESINLVTNWLSDNNIDFNYEGNDLIRFNTTIAEAENLFDMELKPYTHTRRIDIDTYWGHVYHMDTVLRTTEYSIPDELDGHIEWLHPLCNFLSPKRNPMREGSNAFLLTRTEHMPKDEPSEQEWARRRIWKTTEMNYWRSKHEDAREPVDYDEPVPYWEFEAEGQEEGNGNETIRREWHEYLKDLEYQNQALQRSKDYRTGHVRCKYRTIPNCIRRQYGMPRMKDGVGAPPRIRLGIAGSTGVSINREDLGIFAWRYAKDLPQEDQARTIREEIFKGDRTRSPRKLGGPESMIDVQYGYALAHPHEVRFYTTALTHEQSNDNEVFVDLLDYLLSQPDENLPHVLAVPYAESEQLVPRQYAERVCRWFGLLTARGVTIVASSGDGGSAGSTTKDQCYNFGPNVIMASFPATCQWVTAVGGVNTRRKLTPLGMSGGGFSDYFPRPFWQNNYVRQYQDQMDKIVTKKHRKHVPPLDHYQNSMRGVPDVAVIGKRFLPVYDGSIYPMPRNTHHHDLNQGHGLTTMTGATIIFAAMVVHENAKRLKLGKPTLGWLNKRMYEDVPRDEFQDVHFQNTFTCTRVMQWHYWGWIGTPGWDPTTGLGQPVGLTMFDYL